MRTTPFVLTAAGLILGVVVGVDAGPGAGKGGLAADPREAFIALVNEGQPAPVVDGTKLVNALELVLPLEVKIEGIRERVLAERRAGDEGQMMSLDSVMDLDALEGERALARMVLEELARTEVPGMAAAIAAAPRAAMVVPDELITIYALPPFSTDQIRSYQVGRMALAAEASDWVTFRTALRELLKLSEQLGRQPHPQYEWIGVQAEGAAIDAIARMLARSMLNADGLRVVAEELATFRGNDSRRSAEGSRWQLLEVLDWLYGSVMLDPDTAMERLPAINASFGGRFKGPKVKPEDENRSFGPMLPGLAIERSAVNRFYGRVLEMMDRLPADRLGRDEWVPALDELKAQSPMLRSLGGPWAMQLTGVEDRPTQRAAIAAMVALERYRLAHGAYPDGLERLVPEFLTSVPVDAYRGGPLGYRLARSVAVGGAGAAEGVGEGHATQDLGGRGYLLYSVGPDLVDDGGRVDLTDPMPKRGPGAKPEPGWDWVLNQVPPRGR